MYKTLITLASITSVSFGSASELTGDDDMRSSPSPRHLLASTAITTTYKPSGRGAEMWGKVHTHSGETFEDALEDALYRSTPLSERVMRSFLCAVFKVQEINEETCLNIFEKVLVNFSGSNSQVANFAIGLGVQAAAPWITSLDERFQVSRSVQDFLESIISGASAGSTIEFPRAQPTRVNLGVSKEEVVGIHQTDSITEGGVIPTDGEPETRRSSPPSPHIDQSAAGVQSSTIANRFTTLISTTIASQISNFKLLLRNYLERKLKDLGETELRKITGSFTGFFIGYITNNTTINSIFSERATQFWKPFIDGVIISSLHKVLPYTNEELLKRYPGKPSELLLKASSSFDEVAYSRLSNEYSGVLSFSDRKELENAREFYKFRKHLDTSPSDYNPWTYFKETVGKIKIVRNLVKFCDVCEEYLEALHPQYSEETDTIETSVPKSESEQFREKFIDQLSLGFYQQIEGNRRGFEIMQSTLFASNEERKIVEFLLSKGYHWDGTLQEYIQSYKNDLKYNDISDKVLLDTLNEDFEPLEVERQRNRARRLGVSSSLAASNGKTTLNSAQEASEAFKTNCKSIIEKLEGKHHTDDEVKTSFNSWLLTLSVSQQNKEYVDQALTEINTELNSKKPWLTKGVNSARRVFGGKSECLRVTEMRKFAREYFEGKSKKD